MLEKHSDSEVHVEKIEQRPTASIAFGLERLGLIAVQAPILSCIVLVALIVGAIFGIDRIKIDDSLSQLFRSNSKEYRQYEAVTKRFPSTEFDVLVVVEGKTLLQRENLEKIRDLVTDLQLVEGTRGLISLFSARQAPAPGKLPAALFPADLPEGADYDKFVETVKTNEIIRGKLLSEDGTLALIVLSLEPEVVASNKLGKVVGDIRKLMAQDLADSGLKAELSGVPVMQLEIRKAVERDGLTYNILGILAGCIIAIIFFRKISFLVVAVLLKIIAILLALGGLGWANFNLNMFLNVMTPLIMVITFSDSMQLTFAARARLIAGDDTRQAFRNALHIVGPACVLTHGAAALSFIALQISESDLIRTFGQAGLIARLIALVAVLTLIPLVGVLIIALLGVGYTQLQPRYRLADQVPDREQAIAANTRIDTKLTGSNPIDVLIQFPPDASLYAPESLAIIGDVHSVLEHQREIGNVWSLETLRRWLAERQGKADVGTLKRYVDMLPEYLTRRFISAEEDAVVVTGRVPDADASRLLPLVQGVDHSLDAVRARYPGYTIAVTGLSALAARNSAVMIDKLNRGLTI